MTRMVYISQGCNNGVKTPLSFKKGRIAIDIPDWCKHCYLHADNAVFYSVPLGFSQKGIFMHWHATKRRFKDAKGSTFMSG